MSRQLSMDLVINGVLKSFNLGCRSSMGGGGKLISLFRDETKQGWQTRLPPGLTLPLL